MEEEAATGKALASIFHEIYQMGFRGSRSPFYEHFKYLSDGHKGYRPMGFKPIIKKVEKKSQLAPVNLISFMVTHSIMLSRTRLNTM